MHQVLHFVVSRDTSPDGNKTLDRKFYWSAMVIFIPNGESEIKNQLGLKRSCQKIDVMRKNESSLEKKKITKRFFFKPVEIQ